MWHLGSLNYNFSCFFYSSTWITLSCFFACLIIFLSKTSYFRQYISTTLDTNFYTLGLSIVTCLFNCLETWLDYFSEVCFPCSLQPPMSLFGGHSLGSSSLTVSFPDPLNSVTLLVNTWLLAAANCGLVALLFSTRPWEIGCSTVRFN